MKIEDVSQLLQISVSSLKSLLFRARKNINAFYGHYCQWILPDNPCKCLSWKRFIDEKNVLRLEKNQKDSPEFDTPEHVKKHDPVNIIKNTAAAWFVPISEGN